MRILIFCLLFLVPFQAAAQAPSLNRDFEVTEVDIPDWRGTFKYGDFSYTLNDPSNIINLDEDPCGITWNLNFIVTHAQNAQIDWTTDLDFNSSAKEMGQFVNSVCPSVIQLGFRVPRGSRVSTVSVKERDGWNLPQVHKALVDAQTQEMEAYRAAPKFGPSPNHPLADRGVYASREVGRHGNITLYEVYKTQYDYERGWTRISRMIVHSVDFDTPLFSVVSGGRWNSIVRYSDEYIDAINSLLMQSDSPFSFPRNSLRLWHYVDGLDSDVIPDNDHSLARYAGIEYPFVRTGLDFNREYSRILTIPQIEVERDRFYPPQFRQHGVDYIRGSDGRSADLDMANGEQPITVNNYLAGLQ